MEENRFAILYAYLGNPTTPFYNKPRVRKGQKVRSESKSKAKASLWLRLGTARLRLVAKACLFGYLLWWCWVGSKLVNLGGTQKVDFLGTCFGGAGLGLNSWAMIGVHARADVRW